MAACSGATRASSYPPTQAARMRRRSPRPATATWRSAGRRAMAPSSFRNSMATAIRCGAQGVSISSSTAWALSDLHSDADGNVIASWIVLQFTAPHAMYAQKLAAIDGSSALWGTDPVTVFDASDGSLQFGNFPPFVADGAGGAVFVWYSVGANGQVHAQHIMSDGSAGVRAERRARIDRTLAEPLRTRRRLRSGESATSTRSGARPICRRRARSASTRSASTHRRARVG